MEKTTFIDKTIRSLKKRLVENNNILLLQLEEGYITETTCTFNEPISEEDLGSFEKQLGYKLPPDYKEFLRITNGCRLFDHPKFGGENYLYALQDIKNITYEEPNEGFLKVGNFYEEDIYIDLKLFNSGEKNYLFVKYNIDQFHEGRALRSNFELWFDRFVISQGTKFWNYSVSTAENYY